MWYVPISFIFQFSLLSTIAYYIEPVLNPLTWAIVSLPPHHWSCPLLTFISVLRVVIWKLLVKPAVYNCTPAHSTNQSKNHRMPEAMATKTWSQENHKTQESGDSCCDKFILLDEEVLFHLFFLCYLRIDSFESVIYGISHELLWDSNKINSYHTICSTVVDIQT